MRWGRRSRGDVDREISELLPRLREFDAFQRSCDEDDQIAQAQRFVAVRGQSLGKEGASDLRSRVDRVVQGLEAGVSHLASSMRRLCRRPVLAPAAGSPAKNAPAAGGLSNHESEEA